MIRLGNVHRVPGWKRRQRKCIVGESNEHRERKLGQKGSDLERVNYPDKVAADCAVNKEEVSLQTIL